MEIYHTRHTTTVTRNNKPISWYTKSCITSLCWRWMCVFLLLKYTRKMVNITLQAPFMAYWVDYHYFQTIAWCWWEPISDTFHEDFGSNRLPKSIMQTSVFLISSRFTLRHCKEYFNLHCYPGSQINVISVKSKDTLIYKEFSRETRQSEINI